ncbi:MAG: Ger(x)C family spore germination protein [Halanaerobiales bacterium]
MKKVRAIFLLFIIIFIIVSLSGCWDLEDIDQRAIIVALAIDYAETPGGTNYEHTEMIKVTAQLAIPQKLGGGAGQPPEMGEESVWNVSAVGRNVNMALVSLKQKIQFEIFLAHMRALVISEDIAREGISKHINYFKNHYEFRRLSYILISEGKAADIINTYPKTATIQGVYLMNMVEHETKKGRMPDIPFMEFIVRMVNKGIDPITIIVEREEDYIKYSGLAVFKGDEMNGKINVEEGWSFIQLSEKKFGGIEVVRDVKTEIGSVTVSFTDIDSSMRPVKINKDKYLFKIDLQFEGRITSQDTYTDYSNKIFFDQLEQRVSAETKKELEVLFYKIQNKYKADIFGFGDMVRAYRPLEWNKIDDWREKFKKADLEIEVRTNIERVGMAIFKQE